MTKRFFSSGIGSLESFCQVKRYLDAMEIPKNLLQAIRYQQNYEKDNASKEDKRIAREEYIRF